MFGMSTKQEDDQIVPTVLLPQSDFLQNNPKPAIQNPADENSGSKPKVVTHPKCVYKFNVEQQFLSPEKEIEENLNTKLTEDLHSIYPLFLCDNEIFLVHEDVQNNCPRIIRFNVSNV